MLAGPGIQRSEGMLGFDWVTHKGDPEAADSDMDFTGCCCRRRWRPTRTASTWSRRSPATSSTTSSAATTVRSPTSPRVPTCRRPHVLDQAGIARIAGLDTVLPAGATSFDGGNIIIGGGGADLIEGRGGDDVIDGDAQLTVELNVPYKNGTDPRGEEPERDPRRRSGRTHRPG